MRTYSGDSAGNEQMTRKYLTGRSNSMANSPAISQRREYNTLHHIAVTAEHLRASKVILILIYGLGHPFDDVITCFPQLKLKPIVFPETKVYDVENFDDIRKEMLGMSTLPRNN